MCSERPQWPNAIIAGTHSTVVLLGTYPVIFINNSSDGTHKQLGLSGNNQQWSFSNLDYVAQHKQCSILLMTAIKGANGNFMEHNFYGTQREQRKYDRFTAFMPQFNYF